MQFHYTVPQTELEELFGGHFCINAIGKIEAGDAAKFSEFLRNADPPRRCDLFIDSTGGDVEAAIEIGRKIRARWLSTHVGQYQLDIENSAKAPIVQRRLVPGQCMSAATLIYLGGRLRYLDKKSKFGVHQFNFPSATGPEIPRHFLRQSQTLSARIAQYVSDMGISQKFLLLTANTPTEEIRIVDKVTLEKIGVVTGGESAASWTLEAESGISYVKGERDSLYGHHKVMLCFNKESGFRFWAIIETQGRSEELMGFRLIEIVINQEDTRIDISSRAERCEFGIYTHVFAQISEDEARQIAFSESFGVQLRFSAKSELFLGVRAMDTANGRMKLQTFFENHRR